MVETGQQLINTEPEILTILWPHPEQKEAPQMRPAGSSASVHCLNCWTRTCPRRHKSVEFKSIDFAHACGGRGAAAHPLGEPRPVPHADGEGNGMARRGETGGSAKI